MDVLPFGVSLRLIALVVVAFVVSLALLGIGERHPNLGPRRSFTCPCITEPQFEVEKCVCETPENSTAAARVSDQVDADDRRAGDVHRTVRAAGRVGPVQELRRTREPDAPD